MENKTGLHYLCNVNDKQMANTNKTGHAIFFDGTSYFVEVESYTSDEYLEMTQKSHDFDMLCNLCDELNDEL